MKKLIKRVFCMHLNWAQGRSLDQKSHPNDYRVVFGRGRLIPWTCCRCNKVKHFTESEPPIQYLGN